MRSAKIMASFIVLALVAAGPVAQPPSGAQPPLPPSAEGAKQQYAQSIDKAQAEMDALIDKARKQFEETQARLKAAYLQKLDQAIAAETKKGNLDGALALRAEKASVEGGAPADNAAATAQAAAATKTGLIMVWDGKDKDGTPFPFARVIDRIPAPMKKANRALPLKVPDGTPVIFQGFVRIQHDNENMILNVKADAYAQIKVAIDDEVVIDIDNRSDSREFPLRRGLHKISIRFAGENTATYQLAIKRTGAPFTDYVYDPKDLSAMQIVK
jgi:hypothetical protein